MCEAGEGTLLESLKLKGADIPPQSEQQQEEEGESDDVVEVDLETKVKDLSAEQAVQAAQINSLSEDMDNLKDSVFKGGEGIVKPTVSVSSLFTTFQQLAAHAGFKLPMAALEGPAAGASSSAADQAGAAACVTTATAGQPGASVRAPPAGAGQLGAYAGAPPTGAVQPGSSAGALPAGARLPGAAAVVSPADAAMGQPVAAAVIPTAVAGQPKAAAGLPIAAAGQPSSVGVALTAAAAQPCATAGAPKAAAGQHGPATGVAINAGVVWPGDDCWDILGRGSDLTNFPPCVQVHDATGSQAVRGQLSFTQAGGVQSGASAHVAPTGPSGHALHRPNLLFLGSGHPTASVHLPLSLHGPGVQEPPAFLSAAEALDTGSILPGHTSSAPRGTLLNMPSQQVLPSLAASSSFMPSTLGEEEEATGKGFTGVTKKKGKNEWVARIVLDRTSNSLIVISSHFQSEVAAARSIAAASHVMFVDNPTRGDLKSLTGGDRAKLQGCTARQCELMVRQKFWHKWEQWAEYWPAAKAKYDEKERKAAMKRAALDRSLGQPGGRPDKMAKRWVKACHEG
ncbi:unnamed protein product [Closterium sp. NIES-54]